jgi:hypothetical protein
MLPALGPPVSEKLARDNFLLWRAQFMPVLRGAQLMRYLDEKIEIPPEKITILGDDKKAATVPNPEYLVWVAQDQQVVAYLLNSLTKGTLGHVATVETSTEAWKALSESFAAQSKAKVANLRYALRNTKKGSMTMSQYFSKMKKFADELASAGKVLEDEEIVSYILNALDSTYTPLVSSVISRMDAISVNDLYSQAHGYEHRQDMLRRDEDGFSSANAAMRGCGHDRSGSRGGRNPGRGQNQGNGRRGSFGRLGQSNSSNNKTICQICGRSNHTALDCWYRYDEDDPKSEDKFAGVIAPSYDVDTNWYMDTGAIDHITGEVDSS